MDKKMSHFFQNLSELKDSGQFCDIKIIVEDQEFLVHRVIVASFSDFFRAVCSCEMKEALESKVTITHLEKDQVKVVMDYIYGMWQFPYDSDIDQVLRVAEAANYLGISCLSEYCSEFLLCKEDPVDLLTHYNEFESLNLSSLIQFLNVYILKNFESVISKIPKLFSILNFEQLSFLISSDSLVVSSEDKLLSYVEQYITTIPNGEPNTIKEILYQIRPGLLNESFQRYISKLHDYEIECWQDKVSLHAVQQYRASKLGRIMSHGSSTAQAFRERAPHQCFALLSLKSLVLINLESEISEITFELKFPLSSDTAEFCSAQLLGCIFMFLENSTVNSHYLSGQFFLLDVYSLTLHNLPDLSAHIVKFTLIAVDKHLYAIGGIDKGNFISSDKIFDLDLTTMEWGNFDLKLPSPRHSFPVVVYKGNIYISGGTMYNPGQNNDQRQCFKDFFYLDLKNKVWVELPDMAKARFEHTMIEFSDKFYVVGDIQRGHHSIDCYDQSSCQWTTIGDDSSLRGLTRFLGSFSSFDGKLYCFGKYGQRILGENSGRGIWSFDPEKWQLNRLLRTENVIFDGLPFVWPILLNWDLLSAKSANGETITNFLGDLDLNSSEDSDF